MEGKISAQTFCFHRVRRSVGSAQTMTLQGQQIDDARFQLKKLLHGEAVAVHLLTFI